MAHNPLASWIAARKAAGEDKPLLYINPRDNVIVGARALMDYLKIKSWPTLYRLVELYGLPAVKRPDGQWLSTMTAIDQWIFLASEVDNANRQWSRGTNERIDIARRRLEKRLREHRAKGEHGAEKEKEATAEGGS